MSKPNPFAATSVAIIAILILIGLGLYFNTDTKQEKLTEEMRPLKNQTAMERCRQDRRDCLGGFVVWRGGERIARISNCSVECAGHAEVSIMYLLFLLPAELDRFDHIVLPNERNEWERAAIQHAQLFVQKK